VRLGEHRNSHNEVRRRPWGAPACSIRVKLDRTRVFQARAAIGMAGALVAAVVGVRA